MEAGGGGSDNSGSGDNSDSSSKKYQLNAKEIYISKGNTFKVGLTGSLKQGDTGEWKSKNENIATVNSATGEMKAKSTGDTQLEYKITNKTKTNITSLICKVHVVKTTISLYKSDNDNKDKLKMLVNYKKIDDILPSSADRKYSWKSINGGIELDDTSKGRPCVKKINKTDTVKANIEDKLGENDSGIRIRLEASIEIKKGSKPSNESDSTTDGGDTSNHGKEKIKLFAETLYLSQNTSYDNASKSKVEIYGINRSLSKLPDGYTISWKSENTNIASVSKGEITSKGKTGSTNITATLKKNGKEVANKKLKVYVVNCKLKVTLTKNNKPRRYSLCLTGDDAIKKCGRYEWKKPSQSGYTLNNKTKKTTSLTTALNGATVANEAKITVTYRDKQSDSPGTKVKLKYKFTIYKQKLEGLSKIGESFTI